MSVTICPTVPRCHGSYLSQQDVTSLPTALHPKPKTCRGSESQPQLDSVRAWWGGLRKWGWIGFKCCTNTTQNFSLLCKAEKKSKSESVSHSVVSDSLGPQGLYLSRLLCPWNSPDKNTGVGCYFLLLRNGFLHSSVGKESTCNAEDPSSIPGLGISPGEGMGYPLQYSWASLMAQLVKNFK